MKGNPDASWSSGHTGSGDGTGWYTDDDDGYWFTATTGRAFFRGGNWNNEFAAYGIIMPRM